jgi:hypothetical protein
MNLYTPHFATGAKMHRERSQPRKRSRNRGKWAKVVKISIEKTVIVSKRSWIGGYF